MHYLFLVHIREPNLLGNTLESPDSVAGFYLLVTTLKLQLDNVEIVTV